MKKIWQPPMVEIVGLEGSVDLLTSSCEEVGVDFGDNTKWNSWFTTGGIEG